MAIFYVTKSGNDANSGLALATPKLTIGSAVAAASSGDTVQVYRGVYKETVAPTQLIFTIKAIGHVIIDGENLRSYGIQWNNVNNPAMLRIVDGFEIKNHLAAGIFTGANNAFGSWAMTWLTIRNVNIHNNPRGIVGQVGTVSGFTLLDSIIHDCTTGVELDNGSDSSTYNSHLERVTIYNCVKGTYRFGTGFLSGGNHTCRSVSFRNNGTDMYTGGPNNTQSSNYNSFFGSTNVAHRDVTDYATVAAWNAAFGQDANSLTADPLHVDFPLGLVGLRETSPLIGAGLNGENIGARGVCAFSGSNLFNAAEWAAGLFTNTQLNGFNQVELVPPNVTGTYRSIVRDLGVAQTLRITGFDLASSETEPTDVLDFDNTDVNPNKKNIEVRMSMNNFGQGAAVPAYTVIEQGVTPPVTLNGRFIQVRITLRTNGVNA